MRIDLIPREGKFYKANLHCHSTISDGKLTPEEIKALYSKLGYSIVAYTDHNVMIPQDELTDDEFLALHGVELDISEAGKTWEKTRCAHFTMIALDQRNLVQPCWHRSKYVWGNALKYKDRVLYNHSEQDFERHYSAECINGIIKRFSDSGFFVTYNHPTWSLQRYNEYIEYTGIHAFEIMNGDTSKGGFDDYNPRVYDDFLSAGKMIYCIGADDNHNPYPSDSVRSDSGVAFTMIKAEALNYNAVATALKNGHFYASEGPEIHELWIEDNLINIRTSPAEKIFISFDTRSNWSFFRETELSGASFVIPKEASWFRITVVDEKGRHACTNAYPLHGAESK